MIRRPLTLLILIFFGLISGLVAAELGARLLGPPFEPKAEDMYQCDPLVGWRGRPNSTITVNTAGQSHQVVRNNLGMHDLDYPVKREPATFRIMILGDSFVEATEVVENQTSQAILERKLNELSPTGLKFEVISGGILAWGPTQELLYFQTEGHRFQPDLILVMWVPANDFINVLPDHAFTAGGMNCYAPYFAFCRGEFDPEPWYSVPGLAPTMENCSVWQKFQTRVLFRLYLHSRLYQRLALLLPHHQLDYEHPLALWLEAEESDEALQHAYRLTVDSYARLATIGDQGGAATAAVIVPFSHAVYSQVYPNYSSMIQAQLPDLAKANPSLPNERFVRLMADQNIPVLDLQPYFVDYMKATNEDLHQPGDIHWNIRGNEIVAEIVTDWLVEKRLVPLRGGN